MDIFNLNFFSQKSIDVTETFLTLTDVKKVTKLVVLKYVY